MKKFKIEVEETLRFRKEIVISVPDEMSDGMFETLIGGVERQADTVADIPYILAGTTGGDVKVLKLPDNEYSSPDSVEIEITEVEEL